jgi:hypothetical protein
MTVHDAVSKLGAVDFVVTEGFKSLETMAKIVVPIEQRDIDELSNGLEIAIVDVDGRGTIFGGTTPVLSLERTEELANIVEERAFPILSGLNCHGCGYEDCLTMGQAILTGKAIVGGCVGYSPSFNLKVDGLDVSLGPFVQDVTRNVVLGLVRSFKGVERAHMVELVFEVIGKDG